MNDENDNLRRNQDQNILMEKKESWKKRKN